ncbi:MAG: adenylosuccinate synthetase, partial [Haliangium ochraceum]
RGNEFGSVTGRPRRCGWLDVAAVRLAVRLSGIEALALTKLDVMAGLDHVRLCTGYRLAGRTLDEMPADLDDLALAEPIFEDLPGWPELSGPSIPPAAAAFVDRVSALVGIPVWGTSWGPGRLQTIVTEDPFSDPFSVPFSRSSSSR